jgi:hypothetical protein
MKKQRCPAGTRQTEGKNLVWFEEIERKLAKLSMTTFTYRSPLNYFMLRDYSLYATYVTSTWGVINH